MTTIAVDSDLTMASDSQATVGDRRIQHSVPKIFHHKGYTLGFAGRYSEGLAFAEALKDIIDRAELQDQTDIPIPEGVVDEMDNFHALLITPEGDVLEYEGSRFNIPVEVPTAVGSGADYALAAMDCGKSASEAVEVAMKFDVFSGGDIQVVTKPTYEPDQVPSREDWGKKTKKQILDELEQYGLFGTDDEQRPPDKSAT